jgi:hypothetical protein
LIEEGVSVEGRAGESENLSVPKGSSEVRQERLKQWWGQSSWGRG